MEANIINDNFVHDSNYKRIYIKQNMDYEEKYKKTLEKARKELQACGSVDCDAAKQIFRFFPELKESEDERIRKALINGFNKLDKSAVWYNGITNAQILDWLEKQANHANFRNKIEVGDKVTRNRDGVLVNLSQLNRVAKPADEVEPKFKVGDFLVNDYCMGRVVELTDDAYLLDTEQGIPFSCEHNTNLWTIQDAKGGDFLVCGGDKSPFIYKGFLDKFYLCPVAYCGITEDGTFQVNTGDGWWTDEEVFPANKEQREQLLKAISDAGFMWDAEKKELKKIEQKIAWSEEDENKINRLIAYFEDKESFTAEDDVEYANWLKSLSPQNRWKPSDEQIEILDIVLTDESMDDNIARILRELREQLKKLKG